jgi:peptide/nickel transport system permease protein
MTTAAAPARPEKERNAILSFLADEPVGAVALGFLVLLALVTIFAPWVAPYDPVAVDFSAQLAAPDAAHWMGTDPYGRDIMSRLIYGGRTALVIGFVSSALGCTLGAIIGMASGYFGGRTDLIIQRVIDILLAIPLLVLALIVLSILGRRLVFGIDVNLIFAIALPMVPNVARVMRSATLGTVHMPYVEAARAGGFSHMRVMMLHILPNIAAPYLIMLTAYVAQAILLEASLTFLGFGVAEPTPAWGLMLSGLSYDFYTTAPWVIIYPGLAISLTVLAFNLFGDSLRDWLDPKLRRQ